MADNKNRKEDTMCKLKSLVGLIWFLLQPNQVSLMIAHRFSAHGNWFPPKPRATEPMRSFSK